MLELFIYALASYKLTAMLIDYDGPLDVFARIRDFVEKYQPPKYRVLNFDCHFCLGTWVALPFAIYNGGTWQKILIYWLSLSALAWFMHVIEERVSR